MAHTSQKITNYVFVSGINYVGTQYFKSVTFVPFAAHVGVAVPSALVMCIPSLVHGRHKDTQ